MTDDSRTSLEELIHGPASADAAETDSHDGPDSHSTGPDSHPAGPDSSLAQTLGSSPFEDGVAHRTSRGRGLEFVVAGVVALSLLLGSGEALLLVVPLAVALVYHRTTSLGAVNLSASREFSQVSVVPGETVTVEVTVTNESETSIPDVRVRDAVPEGLPVVGGETEGAFSLPPGKSATLTYEVIARRGRHAFERVDVSCRNASGSECARLTLSASRTLAAEISLDRMPLDARASRYTGTLETAFRGSGVEFHSTREYHPSDSSRDIDWRQFAKTGEFTTIQYRDTRAAVVHLVVDRREETHEQVGHDGVTTHELCLYAGEHVAEHLIEGGHTVGLTSVGGPGTTHFPGRNPRQYRHIRSEFTEGRGRGPAPVEGLDASLADDLVSGTPSYTQFVVVTGLYDGAFDSFFERLAGHDRPVLVVCPRHDLVETPGATLTAVRRQMRVDRLRRQGIRVLDWHTDEPLRLAIQRRVGGL